MEMNTTNIKTRVSKTLAGVALAAALMIAVVLPAAANADSPASTISSGVIENAMQGRDLEVFYTLQYAR